MTQKTKKIGKHKKYLINKDSLWSIPLFFFILFFIVIFSIHSPSGTTAADAEVVKNTHFFAFYKVLFSTGIPLVLIGLLLNSSSGFSIDFYSKINSSYLFTNHWLTIFFKISIIVTGSILCALASFYMPDSNNQYSSMDYFIIFIDLFFTIGIVVQIINSVKCLIQNKEDYILIDDETLKWLDDKNKLVNEIKFSEIESCEKILEAKGKLVELIGIQLNTDKEEELKIDFESMSLIPQSEFIYDLIAKQISKNSSNENE